MPVQGPKFKVQSSKFGPQRGVALVITLIMLSVITFMAVTFLALSRREAGSVTTKRDETTARLGADTAFARVMAEIAASIQSTTNAYNFGLFVSTNFVNWDGFDPNPPYDYRTNVNYGWRRNNGGALTANDALQNLANQLLNARPPVFITNRLFANSNEFRFYLDLNRNGRYDTNGYWPEFNNLGVPVTTLSNGVTVTNFVYFIGDPEWIGVLERPDRPHSATNRFVARYAYIVVPTAKTLDVNYAHNQAKQRTVRQEGFLRNQGPGSWEINLAGFFVDLNTNQWQPAIAPYIYNTATAFPSTGVSFDDANLLVNYRYKNNASTTLLPVSTLFGAAGATAFSRDFVDGYSHGPLMNTYWGWNVAPDADTPLVSAGRPWPGADNLNQFFTTQDFFDPSKTAYGRAQTIPPPYLSVAERLQMAGTNVSSYDRSTFYRLLEQLGTESAPESPDKINLNYDNLVQKNPLTGVASATNFYPWEPTALFTNAASALLGKYSDEWLSANSNLFFATYQTNQAFGVMSIPVLVNSNFVYTPSIHRLVQLAANIADAGTNRLYPGATSFPYLPSVFRPIIRRGTNANVYIVGYTSVDGPVNPVGDPRLTPPLDLNNPAQLALVPPVGTPLPANVNVYGVPWVIGAKKGLPNFNEFAMQTIFQVTRKLEVSRTTLSEPQALWKTNMMFVLGLTNVIGTEAWNSYRTNLNRAVDVIVASDMSLALTITNNLAWTVLQTNRSFGGVLSVPATGAQQWQAYYPGKTNSFLVPLRTNSFELSAAQTFSPLGFSTNWNLAWDKSQQFPQPQWGLSVSNRLRFIILDRASQRVIDYVQLDGLNGQRNLSEEIRDPDHTTGFGGLWSTNFMPNSRLPQGIFNQIMISLGVGAPPTADWRGYDLGAHATKEFEIDYFRVLYGLSPFKHPSLVNTSLVQQVPFTPTKRRSQNLTWQANDPLVHYTPGDLAYLKTASTIVEDSLRAPIQPIKNIGHVNDRYAPWGGNPELAGGSTTTDPNSYNLSVKDPGMRQSDDWQFPTNKFPNLGWLGRVHRGTPWQTVYLKSPDLLAVNGGLGTWTNWTGNNTVFFLNQTNFFLDAARSAPASDRILFDLFTTAFNENATRGRLSVNQSGLAAWSALFSGVLAFTNAFPNSVSPVTNYTIVEPAGIYDAFNTNNWPPLVRMVNGINRERARMINTGTNNNPSFVHPGGAFQHVGDILSVPELTDASPYLNVNTNADSFKNGLNDAVVEWLPQQVMSLLQIGEPRFVVYSYGQTLRPAPASLVTSGPFQGLCTNYQITAEVATRAVVRIEDAPRGATPTRPRVVIEKFNLLPPD